MSVRSHALSLRFAHLFSDGLVLQQNAPCAVWGWCEPLAEVAVRLGEWRRLAHADASGRWRVVFDPMPASVSPVELTCRAGGSEVVCRDVWVGEVWLCSGQSNMEWPVLAATGREETIRDAHFPRLRVFKVRKHAEFEPAAEVVGSWVSASPATVGSFSAVAYAFGCTVHRALDVPVGLIDASWGGSTIEAWLSPGRIQRDARLTPVGEKLRRMQQAMARQQETLRPAAFPGYHLDPGNAGWPLGWADPGLDGGEWPCMTVPALWQTQGLAANGAVWFRREVTLSDGQAGRDLELRLGKVDDFDVTYFNGVEVGRTVEPADTAYAVDRVYRVPAALALPGRNVIAVRVFDQYGHGGFSSGADALSLATAGARSDAIPLAGEWRYQVEKALPTLPQDPTAIPGVLFNGMIAPLVPCGLRGAVWYQGESNTGEPGDYRHLLTALIEDWREQWHLGDFPFLYVQLPNFQPPGDSNWAEFRQAQADVQTVPNTGMAVTIDLGEPDNLHPPNKHEVGRRLALLALRQTYGRKTVARSPRIARVRFEGGTALAELDADGSDLVVKGGRGVEGFEVAGEDKCYHPARALLRGNELAVSSDRVNVPVALRYAYANNPRVSLYNLDGLPLAPGRFNGTPPAADAAE